MLRVSHARIIKAQNAFDLAIVGKQQPTISIDLVAKSLPLTYHSTGVQTQPLHDANQYEEIFGHNTGKGDISRNIGLGGLGRYGVQTGAYAYELNYGLPFVAYGDDEDDTRNSDSGFQTLIFADCKRGLAKAKVRASILARRHRSTAEKSGYRVWAESKDDNVIHSEQFPTVVEFDAEGNTKDGTLSGLFLPNIFGEKMQSPLQACQLHPVRSPAIETTPYGFTSHNARTPLTLQKPQQITHDNISILHPIAAHPLSPRATKPDPPSIEDYGEEFIEEEWELDSVGNLVKATGTSGRRDEVPVSVFVVHDAAMCNATAISEQSNIVTPSSLRKRKPEDDREFQSEDTPSKRPRLPISRHGVNARCNDLPARNATVMRPGGVEAPDHEGGNVQSQGQCGPINCDNLSKADAEAVLTLYDEHEKAREHLSSIQRSDSRRRSRSPVPRHHGVFRQSQTPVSSVALELDTNFYGRRAELVPTEQERARRERDYDIRKPRDNPKPDEPSHSSERPNQSDQNARNKVAQTRSRARKERIEVSRWKPAIQKRHEKAMRLAQEKEVAETEQARQKETLHRLQDQRLGLEAAKEKEEAARKHAQAMENRRLRFQQHKDKPEVTGSQDVRTNIKTAGWKDEPSDTQSRSVGRDTGTGEDAMTRARRAEDHQRERYHNPALGENASVHGRGRSGERNEVPAQGGDHSAKTPSKVGRRAHVRNRPARAPRDLINGLLGR